MVVDLHVDRNVITRGNAGSGDVFAVLNVSGSALAPGDVVVYDSAQSESLDSIAVTTTTSADDKLVAGVMQEAADDNRFGRMQRSGHSVFIKVDGTTDISVGDILSTFTSAGIAAKETAGKGGGFAMALEAYSTNDSAGEIKGIICR